MNNRLLITLLLIGTILTSSCKHFQAQENTLGKEVVTISTMPADGFTQLEPILVQEGSNRFNPPTTAAPITVAARTVEEVTPSTPASTEVSVPQEAAPVIPTTIATEEKAVVTEVSPVEATATNDPIPAPVAEVEPSSQKDETVRTSVIESENRQTELPIIFKNNHGKEKVSERLTIEHEPTATSVTQQGTQQVQVADEPTVVSRKGSDPKLTEDAFTATPPSFTLASNPTPSRNLPSANKLWWERAGMKEYPQITDEQWAKLAKKPLEGYVDNGLLNPTQESSSIVHLETTVAVTPIPAERTIGKVTSVQEETSVTQTSNVSTTLTDPKKEAKGSEKAPDQASVSLVEVEAEKSAPPILLWATIGFLLLLLVTSVYWIRKLRRKCWCLEANVIHYKKISAANARRAENSESQKLSAEEENAILQQTLGEHTEEFEVGRELLQACGYTHIPKMIIRLRRHEDKLIAFCGEVVGGKKMFNHIVGCETCQEQIRQKTRVPVLDTDDSDQDAEVEQIGPAITFATHRQRRQSKALSVGR